MNHVSKIVGQMELVQILHSLLKCTFVLFSATINCNEYLHFSVLSLCFHSFPFKNNSKTYFNEMGACNFRQ